MTTTALTYQWSVETIICYRCAPVAIFVNYRRQDSQAITGRIDDHLREDFGAENVYRDVDSIPPGVDFALHIESALERCDLCIAVIGPSWASARLADEADFVRLELEAMLRRDVPIIPVLVEGAALPKKDEIPQSLLPLLGRQWIRVDSGGDFNFQVKRLTAAIRNIRKQRNRVSTLSGLASFVGPRSKAPLYALGVAFAAVVSVGIWWHEQAPVIPVTPSGSSTAPQSGGAPNSSPEQVGSHAGGAASAAHAAGASGEVGGGTTQPAPKPECTQSRCTTPSSAQACLASGKWDVVKKCAEGFCNGHGLCGACAANTFSCASQIGMLCSAEGGWVSSGSSDACYCTAPIGRFVRASQSLVLDTKTSLTWDSRLRQAATWPSAAQTCKGLGMRLPTVAEWRGLIIPLRLASDAHCVAGTPLMAAPFDSAAFSGAVANSDKLWTGTPESSFPGFVLVVLMQFVPNTGQWFAADTDDNIKESTTHAYRCVKP